MKSVLGETQELFRASKFSLAFHDTSKSAQPSEWFQCEIFIRQALTEHTGHEGTTQSNGRRRRVKTTRGPYPQGTHPLAGDAEAAQLTTVQGGQSPAPSVGGQGRVSYFGNAEETPAATPTDRGRSLQAVPPG